MFSSINATNRFLLSFFIICLLFLSLTPQAFGLDSGCIKGDCVNGEGTYVNEKGITYKGQWKDGRLNGPAVINQHGTEYIVRFTDDNANKSDLECGVGLEMFHPDCDFSDRFHRKILLTRVSDSFNCSNNLIPNPKPSEIEWVNKEQQAIDKMLEEAISLEDKTKIHNSDRNKKLRDSTELLKIRIKENIKELIDLINKISFYSKKQEINNEIVYWAKLSYEIIQSEEYWNLHLGIIKETVLVSLEEEEKCRINWKPDKSILQTPWDNIYQDGLTIYYKIIIPYLEGKIKH